jgi:hypothetical protein
MNIISPPITKVWEGRQKGELGRVMLQREVDQSADALGVLPFKVPPSKVVALKTFDFCGISAGEVGTGVLSFSIIPPNATLIIAIRVAAINHVNAEIFYFSGDHTNDAISTSDTQRLRNHKGYILANWVEARVQLRCMLGLLGALLGDDPEVTLAWIPMLRGYEKVESRLHHEIESEHGVRLGPALFVFHIQLILRDWLEDQTRVHSASTGLIPAYQEFLTAEQSALAAFSEKCARFASAAQCPPSPRGSTQSCQCDAH